MNVLVPDKCIDLLVCSVLFWFLCIFGPLSIPIGVGNIVIKVCIHVYKLLRPLVKVNRLDLGDVYLQIPMEPRTSETYESSK